MTGMPGGQLPRVDCQLANGQWAAFPAPRNPAGQWKSEDVFLTDGARRGFVHDGAIN
ncbi:MAG: hypothetical protein J0I10_20220 [Verrucomicrobia bacterium]|nr:hypothetical protein [Verrucomicrobiota bacterium]